MILQRKYGVSTKLFGGFQDNIEKYMHLVVVYSHTLKVSN